MVVVAVVVVPTLCQGSPVCVHTCVHSWVGHKSLVPASSRRDVCDYSRFSISRSYSQGRKLQAVFGRQTANTLLSRKLFHEANIPLLGGPGAFRSYPMVTWTESGDECTLLALDSVSRSIFVHAICGILSIGESLWLQFVSEKSQTSLYQNIIKIYQNQLS